MASEGKLKLLTVDAASGRALSPRRSQAVRADSRSGRGRIPARLAAVEGTP